MNEILDDDGIEENIDVHSENILPGQPERGFNIGNNNSSGMISQNPVIHQVQTIDNASIQQHLDTGNAINSFSGSIVINNIPSSSVILFGASHNSSSQAPKIDAGTNNNLNFQASGVCRSPQPVIDDIPFGVPPAFTTEELIFGTSTPYS
ncbi:unnamed protein product [Adineta steineri]|uniref:Uncharacterized protein n=1 Tax=Adineta steineri TaxID=433720 RepID=A0A813T4A4_9BILA|nr:unnamed protein product [Adineta steineri]CAF0848525.1 unnamed protein product [Adineta steineri]